MKKLLILITLLFLVSCETADTNKPLNCVVGYEEVEGVCEKIADPDPEPNPNPNTNSDDITDYTGFIPEEDATTDRNLVTTDCAHLDNLGDWQPVWCDEFNYTGLPDSSKWGYDVGGHGWGNGEEQYYTSEDEDNAYVDNGYLSITAIRESFNDNAYTSARLITKNTGDWQYGKIEVSAKLPEGRGTWPAIWMLPTDWEYGGWPDSGEIDIMEYVGYDPDNFHGTIHTKAFYHSIGTQIGFSKFLPTIEEEFHVYEIIWEPAYIAWYIDGVRYAKIEFDPEDIVDIENYKAWPFDKDFHLILNIAVGGGWGGAQGVDTTIWPQSMLVDYVRVYQKDYVTGDTENPSDVTELQEYSADQNSLYIGWNKSTDDKLVKEYEVYLDDILIEKTSLHSFYFQNLLPTTDYKVGVVAVDFAGNKSVVTEATFSTNEGPTINERIEAEDYTTMSGIQTEPTSDIDGNLNVGWTEAGDYMEYVLKVTEAGTYTVDFRVAGEGSGEFHFVKNGTILDTINTTPTGGWQNWITITSDSFNLTEGTYTFKVDIQSGGFNLNYFEFKKVD